MSRAGWGVIAGLAFAVLAQYAPIPEEWRGPITLLASYLLILSCLGWLAAHFQWTQRLRSHPVAVHPMTTLLIFIIGGALSVAAWKLVPRSPKEPSGEEDRAKAEAARRLSRIEFRTDSAKPLRNLRIVITLNHSFSPDQLGHFRALVDFTDVRSSVTPSLWIGLRDAYGTFIAGDKKGLIFGVTGFTRGDTPKISGDLTELAGDAADRIELDFDLNQETPYRTLDDLDGKVVHVFITESLTDKIRTFTLLGNNYVLLQTDAKESRAINLQTRESWPWPWPLSPAEQAQPWRSVFLGKPNAPRPMEGAWMFDFDEKMPRKASKNEQTGDVR